MAAKGHCGVIRWNLLAPVTFALGQAGDCTIQPQASVGRLWFPHVFHSDHTMHCQTDLIPSATAQSRASWQSIESKERVTRRQPKKHTVLPLGLGTLAAGQLYRTESMASAHSTLHSSDLKQRTDRKVGTPTFSNLRLGHKSAWHHDEPDRSLLFNLSSIWTLEATLAACCLRLDMIAGKRVHTFTILTSSQRESTIF